MYPVIKPSGRGSSEKVLKILKYFFNLILKFETYKIEAETRIC